MKCRKCKAEIPDESVYCSLCGIKQTISRSTKSRGNGLGSVYKRGKTWTAMVTVGYEIDGKKTRRLTRTKGGFKTKRDALEYLPRLKLEPARQKAVTLQKLYETWLPTHRAGPSTMNCYKSAWKYFHPIQWMKIQDITIDDLQECMDECPHGRRTKENMKALCGLLYKYAIPRHLATLNMGEYLIVSGEHGSKSGIPVADLPKISAKVGEVEGADYVLCQCYLGFRPSEFLALDASNYNPQERAFVGGAKTEAGIDRTVTVSPKIQAIVDRLTAGKSSGPVFCGGNGKAMDIRDYRELFYDVLERCGIDNPIITVRDKQLHTYTPHSCRHTFATLMKGVAAADKDKLELIGHTSDEMLRHYQDVSYEDLRKITDAL